MVVCAGQGAAKHGLLWAEWGYVERGQHEAWSRDGATEHMLQLQTNLRGSMLTKLLGWVASVSKYHVY